MPLTDKVKRNAYLRKWGSKNKDKVRQYTKTYLEKHPQKKLLKASRGNAKAKGLEHSITLDDIVVPEYCPYLKIKLTTKIQKCNTPSTISLDRIDSSQGYVKGNVQVISRLANLMKSYANNEELIQFAKSVLELHSDTK